MFCCAASHLYDTINYLLPIFPAIDAGAWQCVSLTRLCLWSEGTLLNYAVIMSYHIANSAVISEGNKRQKVCHKCPIKADSREARLTPFDRPIPKCLNATERRTMNGDNGSADYAPIGFCMKLLKSNSELPFQSGIMGSLGFIAMGSIIMLESKLVKLSKLYMGLLKSTGSSIIMESFIHAERDSSEGSKAPVFINCVDTMVGSCFTGETIWDWRGNGLFIGGVGGAL